MKKSIFLSSFDKKKLAGKKVILRLDVNLPLKGGRVNSDFRLKSSYKTIKFLLASGASILIIGHIGRRKSDTLKPVFLRLKKEFREASFFKNLTEARGFKNSNRGELFMLENLRKNSGEEKNSQTFAKNLASLGDFYVNDAFASSHRHHASIVLLPKLLPSRLGFGFETEIKELSRVFKPKHPFVVVLGGAKFKTKIRLMKKFLKDADTIFVAGALVHAFWQLQKVEIGKSLRDDKYRLAKPFLNNKKIVLPVDVWVKRGGKKIMKNIEDVLKGDIILDAGTKTVGEISKEIRRARLVVWNGPLGNFEKGYTRGTYELAKNLSKSKAHSVLGGGDTVASIEKLKLFKKFNFVSTGGGAMLDFLAEETLPGIEAVKKTKGV